MSPERSASPSTLATEALPADTVGLLEGIATTRAIRRYRDEPVPDAALRAMLFAATRAPSGSNRQPFRFVVLTNTERSQRAKALIGDVARRFWAAKRRSDGYDEGSGADPSSPKARQAAAMEHYVAHFESAPVVVLPCLIRYRDPNPYEGASVFPACQNLLLAARALGFGGVMTGWHAGAESELRTLLGIPPEAFIAATISIGRPEGGHGPVRRRPVGDLVFGDQWGATPDWAVDPPGTQHTAWRAG